MAYLSMYYLIKLSALFFYIKYTYQYITCNDNIFHFFLQWYVLFLKSLLHYEHNIPEKPQKRWSFLSNNHMIWPIPICKGSTGDIEFGVQIGKSFLKPLEYQIFCQILCLTLPEIVDLVNIGELRYTTTFTWCIES